MSLANAYATIGQYRDEKDKTVTEDDQAIGRELIAVARYIDRCLGRALGFNKDDEDVARIYTPKSGPVLRPDWAETENPWRYGGLKRVLDIDDHVSITSIEIDETLTGVYSLELDASDFELLPRNAATYPEPEPYRQIELTRWGSTWAWPRNGRVRVTGIGGWPAVPSGIVSANLELTAILRLESPRATSRINDLNQVLNTSRAAQDIVHALKNAYVNPAVFV